MRPGRHAAEDGSFRRSAGMAAGRGALLLLIAVVIGVILLNKTDSTKTTTVSQTPTTAKAKKTATSTTFLTTTTTVAAHDPTQVKVLPVNGTDTSGIGGRAKDALLAAKYNALTPTDAKNKPAATTVIFYAAGYQPDAAAIATLLHIPGTPNLQPMPADRAGLVKDAHNVAAAHVIVVVGNDIASSLPKATTTTTSTTAKKTTASSSTTTSTTARPASTTSTTKKP